MVRSRSFMAMIGALAFALAVSACAPDGVFGEEKKTPLPGQRKALFPQGVPGVEFNAPPTQPGNSNIAINPDAIRQEQEARRKQAEEAESQKKMSPREARALKAKQDAEARAQRAAEQRAMAKEQATSRTAARSKKNTDEDPWSEAR